METIYGNIPLDVITRQRHYFYGSIVDLLYRAEEGYPFLDERIQSLINQISGSIHLFNNDPKVMSIVAFLENAKTNPEQFRKNILDAANMVDQLDGGDSDV